MAILSLQYFFHYPRLRQESQAASSRQPRWCHSCDPSTPEAEDLEFEASQVYTVRPCLKQRIRPQFHLSLSVNDISWDGQDQDWEVELMCLHSGWKGGDIKEKLKI
jgi:hypothetical protein